MDGYDENLAVVQFENESLTDEDLEWWYGLMDWMERN